MQETMIHEDISKLDLSKVAALQQKRTLAFVNHFVITTVQFLNQFMKKCEQKLIQFERQLEKVEASMVLLEARLLSIPEVNEAKAEEPEHENTVMPTHGSTDRTETEEPNAVNAERMKEESDVSKEVNNIQPEYERFIKMVHVGVPLQAVKLKVTMEGLDPNILEQIINK